jgi:hypothetical protein
MAAAASVRPWEPWEASTPAPMPEEDFLARLWSVLTDPATHRRWIGPPWRPRLARNPHRLKLPRRGGALRKAGG